MRPLRSLQSRIFLASALLTVLSIGVAIYLVSVRVNREAESALQDDIVATRAMVDQLRTTRAETFGLMARLLADTPKLKAAIDTNDPPTVQDVADENQERLHSNILVVTNRSGQVLARVGATLDEARGIAIHPSTMNALQGREGFDILPASGGMLQLATVPVTIGLTHPEVLGALSVGFLLDDALAGQLKSVTGSDVAFGLDGRILASTLPGDLRQEASSLLKASSPRNVTLGTEEYVALALPLAPGGISGHPSSAAAVILRSRVAQVRFLREINTELAVTAVVGVLLATLLSFVVARTITRPLAAITAVMRDVASTGDLTRKIGSRGSRRWQDEDARLLATTFNTLTESIARFQREMSQKERLLSLGRLSTVIAHEVRNPLMIIKTALHTLRQPDPAPGAIREAASDIDGEVARLNRIVNDVLDFARPIRFELSTVDLNALCRESAAAAQATAGPAVAVDLDAAVPRLTSDAEHLRLALVNLIMNARQAIDVRSPVGAAAGAAVATAAPDPPVRVSTAVTDAKVVIRIIDAGRGIDPADLPRIFDPYFTTKRGGTGLGLPIAKNIVEGLGGTLTVVSAPERGTEIRLELPIPPSGERRS